MHIKTVMDKNRCEQQLHYIRSGGSQFIIKNVEQVAVAKNPEAYEYYLKAKYKYEKRENMEDTEEYLNINNTTTQVKINKKLN